MYELWCFQWPLNQFHIIDNVQVPTTFLSFVIISLEMAFVICNDLGMDLYFALVCFFVC